MRRQITVSTAVFESSVATQEFDMANVLVKQSIDGRFFFNFTAQFK
jgi:hypothetical protein